MRKCTNCNKYIDEFLLVCPMCGHDFLSRKAATKSDGKEIVIRNEDGYPYIEIHFPNVPDEKTREIMKCYGWRFIGKKRCWSNKNTPENLMFARSLAKPKEEVSKPYERILVRPRVKLEMQDVLIRIRNNSFYCNIHHVNKDMAGEIEICDRYGNSSKCLFPIAYCASCNLYYILEGTYEELKKLGVIIGQIMKPEQYEDYKKHCLNFNNWREEGPLKIMGYNANKESNYTDIQRQKILARIMEKNVLSRDHILSYLDTFIKTHTGAKDAICKWKSDRRFVEQYNILQMEKIKIKSFYVFDRGIVYPVENFGEE